ncbi:putative DNA binding domain-containing protein [Oceanotoga sp. DSM 15011]|uniref:RNA-binding domain-containing protein n=1 Tax=Oceanotoga sp. DSM 15011 TaxID=2984951 RepID=UPI0021F479E9|nr:RNA-binding domain-containing protein [Oceanotoga sp. DSM 15011]UYO99142.1 putative DNA binding domain-containing protein [Oceanotoga sp. DSM 15011]
MNLLDEILKGESKILELKEKIPKKDSLIKTIIAFSNTSGGKIVIGVKDNREIIGLDENIDFFEFEEKFSSIVYDNCFPNIIPEIYTTNIANKILFVIEISKGNLTPYYYKKFGKNEGTYIRIGSTNRKAEYENILELERQKRNISYDEETCYDFKLEDLNYLELKKRFQDQNKILNKNKMMNLKLIKKEDELYYPTNGFIILLGLQENCSIKCSRFKGKTMEIFLDKKEYSGNLFEQLENSEKFILNHIDIYSKIEELQRKDIPEIPKVAIREALVNAIVHRDYSNLGRDIKVGVYDDVLNIVSPGGLPSTLTEKDILNGRSEIRNRVIARVFKELKYIEQWGSGINRIKNSCLNSNLETPLIRELGDSVDVTIYRKNIGLGKESAGLGKESAGLGKESAGLGKESAGLGKESAGLGKESAGLDEKELKIIKYINENNSISTKIVTEILNIKERRARIILSNLVKNNILIRKGKGRNTHYILKPSH